MNFLPLAGAFITAVTALTQVTPDQIHLDRTEYVLLDTGKSETFHLRLINTTDSLVVIEDVKTSCGCVMATPQRVVATREQPGDIYVGLLTAKVSPEQPTTVDVYTNRNRVKPLRLYIWKRGADSTATSTKK
jgi:hypothetical protein